MSRVVQITDTHTVFVQSGGPWVRILTKDWIAVTTDVVYTDINYAVSEQIRHWMSGVNDFEYLVERLQVHQLNPTVIK